MPEEWQLALAALYLVRIHRLLKAAVGNKAPAARIASTFKRYYEFFFF